MSLMAIFLLSKKNSQFSRQLGNINEQPLFTYIINMGNHSQKPIYSNMIGDIKMNFIYYERLFVYVIVPFRSMFAFIILNKY